MRSGFSAVWMAVMLFAQSGQAASVDAVRSYIFGNSLIHHVSDDPTTNVPHWLNAFAKAAGTTFATDGQFGFLRTFASSLPPTANWGFPGVEGVWSPDEGAFGEAEFTDIVITPANFIQGTPATAPFDGDNSDDSTPVSATLKILDWVTGQGLRPRVHIYEGWADMAGVARRFPPSGRDLRRYHAFNRGDYHAWYGSYVAALQEARPDIDITLIPVASVLSEVLATTPLSEIPAEALYSDDAPHGTASLYFLAAMITYTHLYGAPPPRDYAVPGSLHAVLRTAYPDLVDRLPDMLPEVTAQGHASPPGAPPQPLLASAPERDWQAAGNTGTPALGVGLNGLADWSTQHPFIDLMKSARQWVGHLPGQWGGYTVAQMRAEGHLDANGWPRRLPPEVERIEAILLTDQPEDAVHLRGAYRLFYDGQGTIDLKGRAHRIRHRPGEIRFRYEPGEGLVGISISALDPDDPIRNIRVIREEHLPLYEDGALFNPEWIAKIRDLRVLRFMDWMSTNGSPIERWEDRPRTQDYTWTGDAGVPLPVMVALANQVGADPWFTLPHGANDDYVRRFAEEVRETLDSRRKAYVEYSNEMWNDIFPQADYARAQAEARWGPSDTGWMQFYGLRAAQVMTIWEDVFGDAADRLIRVGATHTGWPGLEEYWLFAPLAIAELGHMPKDSFDAYGVTGYFGYEMGGEEMAATMQGWLDASEDAAHKAGEDSGLQRVALREFVRENRYQAAFAPVTDALLDGSLKRLVQEVFPYHAGVAADHDLQLVMYEGGTHIAAHGARVNDDRLTEFMTRYNYSDEMAGLYEVLLTGWVQAGGTLFNAFVDVAPASQWGSWGALRHLDDSNPRWDVLMDYNQVAPSGWEARMPEDFADAPDDASSPLQ